MLYLVLLVALGTLIIIGYRVPRTRPAPPTRRVIGPDDDPDFLWRLSRGDNNPR